MVGCVNQREIESLKFEFRKKKKSIFLYRDLIVHILYISIELCSTLANIFVLDILF